MDQLAIEMSTRQGSIALRRDGRLLAAYGWDQGDRRQQHLFRELPGFLREEGRDPAAVGEVVVGLGPGSFAGIRVALATAHGLALPGDALVVGLPSAAVLARAACPTDTSAEVVVVGDARRQHFWLAHYRWCPPDFSPVRDPELVKADLLHTRVPADAIVLSPDGDRIGPTLAALLKGPVRDAHPSHDGHHAELLGLLADDYRHRGLPLAPAQPLYLHPPVEAHGCQPGSFPGT